MAVLYCYALSDSSTTTATPAAVVRNPTMCMTSKEDRRTRDWINPYHGIRHSSGCTRTNISNPSASLTHIVRQRGRTRRVLSYVLSGRGGSEEAKADGQQKVREDC